MIAAAFAVYAPSLRNGFVWDDTALVLRDPLIRSWRLIPEGFCHFLFTDATASNFYRPIQRLTYVWDYAWFGFAAPWGWHFTNIALHAAASVMLFLFLEKLANRLDKRLPGSFGENFLLARNRALALLAALIWTIHPLHTAAVCYVAGRADLLAAMFGFAGLWLALREKSSDSSGLRVAHFGAPLWFLAAMLSKESGVTALAVWILLILLLFKQKVTLVRWLVFTLVILAAYSALRFSAEHETPPTLSQPLAPAARPILAARAVAEYAGLLVAPLHLHMERDVVPFGRGDSGAAVQARARLREYQMLLGIALVVTFVFWMRWARKNTRLFVFACLLALVIAYLPVSNLLPLNASVAEHWLYFPSAFLLAAALWSATIFFRKLRAVKITGTALLLAWMAFLATRTFVRNFAWHDPRTFFERTIADGGDSARMFINLGSLESAEGHQNEAIRDFQIALERSPDQPFALLGLAAADLRARDFDAARALLEKVAQIPFLRAQALQNLAVLEYQQSHADRVDLLREAAALAPKNWDIQKRYIGHLAERGEIPRAISELRELAARQPFRAESWRMLGDLRLQAGETDFARRSYERAAALDVRDSYSRERLRQLNALLNKS